MLRGEKNDRKKNETRKKNTYEGHSAPPSHCFKRFKKKEKTGMYQ